MQKKEIVSTLNTIYSKVNSKWVKDLYVRLKTLKLLEENTGQKLHDIGSGSEFLYRTPKAQVKKEKNR